MEQSLTLAHPDPWPSLFLFFISRVFMSMSAPVLILRSTISICTYLRLVWPADAGHGGTMHSELPPPQPMGGEVQMEHMHGMRVRTTHPPASMHVKPTRSHLTTAAAVCAILARSLASLPSNDHSNVWRRPRRECGGDFKRGVPEDGEEGKKEGGEGEAEAEEEEEDPDAPIHADRDYVDCECSTYTKGATTADWVLCQSSGSLGEPPNAPSPPHRAVHPAHRGAHTHIPHMPLFFFWGGRRLLRSSHDLIMFDE